MYADLIGFDSPSILTDTENRPDCTLRLTGENDSEAIHHRTSCRVRNQPAEELTKKGS